MIKYIISFIARGVKQHNGSVVIKIVSILSNIYICIEIVEKV